MKKLYLSRSQSRSLSADHPVGDPFGGAAYGEKNDPVTIMVVASSVMSAIGSVQQGQRAAEASRYNAALARQQAEAANAQAAANAAKQQREALKKMGQMRASYGASGITIEGSAMDVMAESAATAELDRLNILYGGAIKAHGLEGQALLDEKRAENALEEGYNRAGTALLMGGAKAYGGMVGDTQAPAPVEYRNVG